MTKIAITLSEEDLLELQNILLDDDADLALDFVKNRIGARLPAKGTSPCDSTRINPYLQKPPVEEGNGRI